MEVSSNVWRRLELWLAAAVIALSLFHAGQLAVAMATHSLSTDEFGTVGSYSSKGPMHVATDYRAPKNHIFFNLANSVLPARDSLAPARVRALSILATLATGILIAFYAAWRRRWMEGALLLALWSSAPQMLPLSMEARGYGFLGLFAVLSSIAVVEYSGGRRWLWLLGICVALGVYTVPGFLFFAAPLMFLLWIVRRDRATFVAGVATAAAILALYAPLLGEVFAAFRGFHANKAEADFESIHGWIRAVKLYLFQGEDWAAWALLAIFVAAPFLLPARERRSALQILSASCAIYLVSLLCLRTPPVRMAAFCLLPLGMAGIWSIGGWFRQLPSPLPGVIASVCASAFLMDELGRASFPFRFLPTENWSLAGKAIDAAFPENIRIDRSRAKYLRQTLPNAEKRWADFDAAEFAAGRLVVAEAGNKWAEGNRFVPPPDLPRTAQWRIPGTIRDIVLNFCLPKDAALDHPPAPIIDGRTDTGVDVPPSGIELQSTTPGRAMILLLNRAPAPDELRAQASGTVLLAGNAVVVPFDSKSTCSVRLSASRSANLDLVEAWISR